MGTIVTNLTTLFNGAMDMAGDVFSSITAEGHEIALAFVLIPLVGLGIGICRRLLKIGR